MKKNVTKKAMGMVKWFLPFYLFTFLPLSMMAQDDDDMYFVPTKKAVERQQQTYGVPQYTYYPGSNRNVDEYNRRFQPEMIDTAMIDTLAQDYELTQKMSRWDGYEPSQSYWDGYADGRRDGAWHSPWFYNSLYPWYDAYWYDPWYMDRWYLYRGVYDPWYWGYGYYGYASWYGPWYGGYGYYGPYYGGYAYSTGTTGTQNHGKINYNGPRGISNGRSTTYSAGTFGGSRIGSSSRSTGTLGSRQNATRNSSATTTAGRTTNAYGNFGGNRARSANTTPSTPTRTYTPATSSSSSGMSSGGSFGGSRSSGGGSSSGGGGGRFGGRR